MTSPENLEVEDYLAEKTEEFVENGIFEDGYDPWELINETNEGEARWDETETNTTDGSGSIYVRAEQEGDGTSEQKAYWEQDIGPTDSAITINAARRKNITFTRKHPDCNVSILVELLVYDTGTETWETIYGDNKSENSGWLEFGPDAIYTPKGEVNAVRANMSVQAEGETLGGDKNISASGELWMDDISIRPTQEFELTVEEPDRGYNEIYINGTGYDETFKWPYRKNFTEGTEVELNATSEEGWTFKNWTVNGENYSGENGITLTMNENKTAQANFVEEAFFEVMITNLTDNDEFKEGEKVTINYTVSNIGDLTDTQDIEFTVVNETGEKVNGKINQDITLGGEESIHESFEWQTEEGDRGEYDLIVASEDDTDEVTITVLKPAFFEITIVDYDEEVIEGENFTVNYKMNNTGDVEDTQNITFLVNGDLIDTEENINLKGGQVHEGEFIWNAGSPGEYELTVASGDDTDDVNVTLISEHAYYEVKIIEPEDMDEFEEGEEVIVNYNVTNYGNEEGNQTIYLYVDGDQVDAVEDIELEKRDYHKGEFTWTAEEPYENRTLTVESDNDSDEVTITVLKSAFFEITIVSYDEEVIEGENITVNYSVTNTGHVIDTQDIEFFVNDDLVDTEEDITLKGGEVYEGEFIWKAESAGEYELKIATRSDNHQEDSRSFEVTSKSDGWLPTWWPFLILIAAAFIAMTGGILYKKRSSTEEPIIEEVFLISQRNSMLILHNTRRLQPDRDSDIIAGMFEAVQNFIEDSFQDTEDWELNKLEFGGNKIAVERGEHVYMAVVYEGELGEEKIQELRDFIEKVEERFGEKLKEWDGDRNELRGLKDMTKDLFS
ncbi:MAG: hypothetical protein KGY66_07130 [Candidatus Thermoplasmatota archaeon]|nr:hypothetical protein [Candidatus Thermoplasmatota archaeon]